MFGNLNALSPYLLSVLRIVFALVLFSFGTQKILGFPFSARGPDVLSLSWIAGLFELVVGFFLLIGFLSRPAAFILSGLMAFAYFIGHAPKDFFPSQNGGVAAILFCFGFLYIMAAGPGPISVDAWRKARA